MTIRSMIAFAAVIGSLAPAAFSQNVDERLEALRPFVGKTWKGEFVQETGRAAMFDVSRWDWALSGRAVRVVHSVNDGAYGGETIIMWSEEEDALVAHYFTTEGFMTRSTIQVHNGRFESRERVTGHSGGITEVFAVAELLSDGTLTSHSRYLRNGEREDGHSIVYRPAPDAQVIFREVDP